MMRLSVVVYFVLFNLITSGQSTVNSLYMMNSSLKPTSYNVDIFDDNTLDFNMYLQHNTIKLHNFYSRNSISDNGKV